MVKAAARVLEPARRVRAFGVGGGPMAEGATTGAREAGDLLFLYRPKVEQESAALLGEGKAHLPKRLQAEFHKRRFEGESAAPLDHEGVEFLLTGVDADAVAAAPGALETQRETERSSDLLGLLGGRRERSAIEPLLEGVWA